MNCAAAEVAALDYFWPKMTLGGIVLLDDYAYWGSKPIRDAHDALAKKLNVEIASLPTGQGLLIR